MPPFGGGADPNEPPTGVYRPDAPPPSTPPTSGPPHSAPPSTYGAPTSAPPGTYGSPTSGPPAAGVFRADGPPTSAPPTGRYGQPTSGPPGTYGSPTGLYGAPPGSQASGPGDQPPTSTVYGSGQSPHFSDLVTHPGQEPAPHVALGPLPGSDEPPPRKSRKALVVSLVVVAVVFLLAVAGTGVVVALNNAGDGTFAVNSCVKRDGEKAIKASCSENGAYTIVSKQAKQEDCPDPNQPFIVLQHKGSDDQVLCLRPANQK